VDDRTQFPLGNSVRSSTEIYNTILSLIESLLQSLWLQSLCRSCSILFRDDLAVLYWNFTRKFTEKSITNTQSHNFLLPVITSTIFLSHLHFHSEFYIRWAKHLLLFLCISIGWLSTRLTVLRLREKEPDGATQLLFDISIEACSVWGFYHGDRVKTPKGKATGIINMEQKYAI
jgi:hypothetical protein